MARQGLPAAGHRKAGGRPEATTQAAEHRLRAASRSPVAKRRESVGLQDSGTKRERIRQYPRPVVTTARRSLMTGRGLPSRPWRSGLRSGPDPRAPQPLSRNGRRTGRTSARCRWRMPVPSLGAWVRRPRRCVHGRDPGHGAALDDIIFIIGQNGASESILVSNTVAHPCLGPRFSAALRLPC